MIVCITNTKGGVGKTTLCANLGGYLADQGMRVLAVDADIQPTLSSYYPMEKQASHGLRHLITEADVTDVVSTTSIPGFELIYSDDPRGTLQNFILHTADGRQRLDYTLRKLSPGYDVILIDTQGAVGPLQQSAIFAGDIILSPIRPDKVSAFEFHRGSVRVVSEQRTMGTRIGMKVGPMYGLLYGLERTLDCQVYLQGLTGLLEDDPDITDISLLKTRVPATAVYKAAATKRQPVHRIDRRARGKTPCAAEVMSSLARELLPGLRLNETPNLRQ